VDAVDAPSAQSAVVVEVFVARLEEPEINAILKQAHAAAVDAEEDEVAIFEEENAGGVRLLAKPANSRFRFIG